MTYNFTVDATEAQLIMQALQELPFKISAALIQKLALQGQEQDRLPPPPDKTQPPS